MIKSKKISTIIPTFNRKIFLKKAIQSCLDQTVDHELIVCNHGSSDGTDEMIKQFEAKIKYIKRNKDFGPHFCWLDGIMESTGDYINLLYDDDWIDPNPYHNRTFVMEPMCNHHKGELGYGPYLSRPYWEAMVKMFGHSPELGVVSYNPDAVKPELVTCSLNTMTSYEPDAEGDCCDIMEYIMLSRGLTIKPDVDSC